jgi:hypothetical protein
VLVIFFLFYVVVPSITVRKGIPIVFAIVRFLMMK